MKKFFNKFLWGILWLLSITLITTLWMNTNYGFDMLSAAHWEYLGTLQAHRSEIKPDFYISLIGALFIALIGLYLIFRPRTQHIKPIQPTKTNIVIKPTVQPTQHPTTMHATTIPSKIQSDFTPRPAPAISLSTRPTPPMGLRPPTTQPRTVQTPSLQSAPHFATPVPKAQNTTPPEIQQAFEANEYIIKKCDHIGKLEHPIVAISYDQSVWIVANHATPDNMVDAIQTLVTIFDDTLGDTANDIKLRGFIIDPTEPSKRNDALVITFDNTVDFVKYVKEHKNTKPEDYDTELFDAFSTYISTVTGYIGKA